MSNKLSQVIKSLKKRPRYQRVFQNFTVMVIREDGLLLWTNGEKENQTTSAVLMGGAWKAAEAILELRSEYHSLATDIFRLSFDTSQTGIYMIPVEYPGGCLLMGMLFQNEIKSWPGQKPVQGIGQAIKCFAYRG